MHLYDHALFGFDTDFFALAFVAGCLAAASCQSAPSEQPDTLLTLATVQSGPRVQADELNGAIGASPAIRPC